MGHFIPHTEETKRKLSESKKRQYLNHPEIKFKISQTLTGRKRTPESLAKFKKTRTGYHHTEESKKKMSLSQTGRVVTEEVKLKISRARIGKYIGERHPNWKGGISKNVHSVNEPKYKQWRNCVFKRDKYTCQGRDCGKTGGYLEAHHIKSWARYPELRYDVNNGLSLCKDCHKLTNNYRGKNIWLE